MLARIPDERIEEPLLDGGWSAKDLMAHVAQWEMAFLSNLGEPPPPVPDQGGEEATNRAVYEYHRTRPLLDVRREFQETHRRLIERLLQFDDDGLNAQPVPGNDTVVWQYVAGETWEHYPAHVAQLEHLVRTDDTFSISYTRRGFPIHATHVSDLLIALFGRLVGGGC